MLKQRFGSLRSYLEKHHNDFDLSFPEDISPDFIVSLRIKRDDNDDDENDDDDDNNLNNINENGNQNNDKNNQNNYYSNNQDNSNDRLVDWSTTHSENALLMSSISPSFS